MADKPKTTYIDDRKLELKELQDLVGGSIQVAFDDGKHQIICNEEGKMMGFQFNKEATIVWRDKLLDSGDYEVADWIENGHDFLVGDILILSKKARLK